MKQFVIGILAHVDAGKTTLSEAMLYLTGSIRQLGRVDNRDAFLDTYELEKSRGITIFSKQAVFALGGSTVTLLDTPGHVDFSAEMERTLQALDYAILVISGADGVQGHTQTLWRLLKRYRVPVFIFVNKMDQPGADRAELMAGLRERLDENCVDFGMAGQDEWMEELATCDEMLLTSYLKEGAVGAEDIAGAVRERRVFPCYFGSALKLDGVDVFLNGIRTYAQCPDYPEEFGAKVFKISRDEQGNRLTHMKITGGRLKVKEQLGGPEGEKINQIRIYSGAKYDLAGELCAGGVCAVTGPSATRPGQGFGIEAESATPVLEPVLTYQLVLPQGCDIPAMLKNLRQLEEEDPLLRVVWREELEEIQVQVMGDVQMEILECQIRERFAVEVGFGKGNIVYKETILRPVEGVGHFEPLRHYAEVHLLMEPGEPGSGLQFSADCSEDVLDRNWQRLILTHLEEKRHRGILTGSEITDMRITLVAGRAHIKHTEGGDFRQATYRAVRQGLKEAGCRLLEPYYEFRLEIPAESVGRAMADIERMHGTFEQPSLEGGEAVITGSAPAATMQAYQREVVSYTKGRGRLACVLKGYEPCHNEQEVVVEIGYDFDADLHDPAGSVFCSHGAGYVVPWDEVKKRMHLESVFRTGRQPGDEAVGDRPVGDEAVGDRPLGNEAGRDKSGGDKARLNAQGRAACSGGNSAALSSSSAGRSGVSYSSYEEDRELEEIFVRTFGEPKRPYPPGGPGGRLMRPSGKEKTGQIQTEANSGRAQPEKKPGQEPEEEYLLVDGYNIIYAWDELRELAQTNIDGARYRLMDILCNYQGYKKCTLILVFDAYKVMGNTGEDLRYHNIHVIFTKEAETADQYIEKLAHRIGRKYRVTVATSDGLEQLIIRGQGCLLMSARDLKEEVGFVGRLIEEEKERQTEHGKNYLLSHADLELSKYLEKVRLGEEKE